MSEFVRKRNYVDNVLDILIMASMFMAIAPSFVNAVVTDIRLILFTAGIVGATFFIAVDQSKIAKLIKKRKTREYGILFKSKIGREIYRSFRKEIKKPQMAVDNMIFERFKILLYGPEDFKRAAVNSRLK